jgi:hypothetical protein
MHERLGVAVERRRNRTEHSRNRAAEGLDGRDQHDGDEGQEDRVFGRRRAAIVFQKLNQVTHVKNLPYVEGAKGGSAFDHPADSTRPLQTRVK